VRFLFLPEGEDPDTLVRKEGKELFNARIDKAQPISEFLFAHLSEDLDLSSMDGRSRMATLALPQLARLPGGFLQELMIEHLAELTRIDSQTLKQQLQHEGKNKETVVEGAHPAAVARKPALVVNNQVPNRNKFAGQENSVPAEDVQSLALTHRIIRLLLQLPQQAQLIAMPNELRDVDLPHTNLLIAMLECFKKMPTMSTAALLGHWHDTREGNTLAGLAAQEFLLCDSHAELEISEALHQLRKLHISRLIQNQIAMDRSSGSKDGSKLRELLELKKTLHLKMQEAEIKPLEN